MLGLHGCTPLLDPEVPHALIFDIGGGSTEVTWLTVEAGNGGTRPHRAVAPRLQDSCSIPIGVVTLAEHYGGHEVSGETYAAMVRQVAERLGRGRRA